jgi:murein tripeptide amidase MpaA
MAKPFLILMTLIAISYSLKCHSQDINKDKKLRDIVMQYGQADVTVPYNDRSQLENLSQTVSIFSVRNKQVHISLSPLTLEWFIQQKFNYQIIDRDDNKGVVNALDITQAMEWDTYPTYSQYDSIMQSFITIYPDLCHLDTIGISILGKRVFVLKISDNPGIDEDEPEVFYTSTIHGDELAGYVLMLRLVDYLLKNYNLDNRIKNLIDNLEIWINPLANPDGTYKTGNLIASPPSRFNANGYDLNRNFPDPATPNSVKQKETLDMVKFMRDHRFVISANFHSGSEVVNYPWDKWYSKYHADEIWFNSISRAYADTVHIYSGPAYMNELDNGVTRGADWYLINGGRQDFVTWELQGREVTIEIDLIKETPAAQLELLWQYNWRSFLGYLENALYGIHGTVHNTISNEPVAARIFINGHDKDSSHVYSDSLSGSFVRLLSPGSWNLTFSANGYYDTTITNITVFSGQKTDIAVRMDPKTNGIDTIIPEALSLYPNPAKDEINVILHDRIIGSINVKIINQSGILVSDYKTETIEGFPMRIDIKGLAAGTYTLILAAPDTKTSYRGRFIIIK